MTVFLCFEHFKSYILSIERNEMKRNETLFFLVVIIVVAIIVIFLCMQSMNIFRLMKKKASFQHFISAGTHGITLRANVYGLLFIFNNCNDVFLSFRVRGVCVCVCVLFLLYFVYQMKQNFQFWISILLCNTGTVKKIETSAPAGILFHRCQIMV